MKRYDFIGIVGIGPFNLSVAALAEGLDGFSSLFLERKPDFAWHPGMMVPDCAMQTSFLKDLVSAVEPTNRYSFVNYLVQQKKFYRFLTTEQRTVSREEFSDYLAWVAKRLSNLAFNQPVTRVTFSDATRLFTVETAHDCFQARHVCLGIGKQARLPACVTEQHGKRVTIVGGGQSGADLFLNIFRGEWGQPAALNWVSRRNNYNALDEAAFANEYFTPEYLESFSTLDESARQQMLSEQKMTSDGITSESLLAIYRALGAPDAVALGDLARSGAGRAAAEAASPSRSRRRAADDRRGDFRHRLPLGASRFSGARRASPAARPRRKFPDQHRLHP